MFTHLIRKKESLNRNYDIDQDEELSNIDEERKSFKQKISKPAMDYIKENNDKKEQRKNEAYIAEQYRYNIKDKIYTDYKTIDINDGKSININRLEEIIKLDNENLYSAYIDKVENEDENEIEKKPLEDIPDGYPVLFTTQNKIEEIVENDNKEEISKFIELISNISKDKQNEIQYLGGLDKEGRIYKTTENCSEEIKQKIEEIKNTYKEEIKQYKMGTHKEKEESAQEEQERV